MDIPNKDILEQLLVRLDKMDHHQQKLDRVMERLTTIQNILEKQNKKQNSLDEQLVAVTAKLQQQKADMTEQLHEALQEIAEPIRATDGKEDCIPSPHRTTQALQGFGSLIGEKLKSIDERTVDTAEKCQQLTFWSSKMEDKINELADNRVEMKTFLVEMRSVKDLIKGQTNSELIWLNDQINKKLTDIGSVVSDIHQYQTEAKEGTVCSTNQAVKTIIHQEKQQRNSNELLLSEKPQSSQGNCDKRLEAFLDLERKIEELKSSVLNVSTEVKTSLDSILTTQAQSIIDVGNTHFKAVLSELQKNRTTVTTEAERQASKIISTVESAKDYSIALINTEGDNTSDSKVELENTHLVTVAGNIHPLVDAMFVKIQRHMDIADIKMDNTRTAMLNSNQTMKKRVEELTNDLKDYIYLTKREIFAVTEKEAQIIRNRIKGPLPSQRNYTFDFYVNNFKTLVKSGKYLHSLPWHINEVQTCVSGYVRVLTNGHMEVWLLHGRHAGVVGLPPRSGKALKVTATIADIHKKKLPPVIVGEGNFIVNEAEICWNAGIGCRVGTTACASLLLKGYGKEEGYYQDALLIRYQITVK